jgi:hypothetical protein
MNQAILLMTGFLLITACSGNETHSKIKAQPYDHSYAAYTNFLAEHVSDGMVAYAKIKANRDQLDTLVDQIAAADLKGATRDQLLAFYCNAYNILTIRSVVDAYPVASIRDIDGVWDSEKWLVATRKFTLSEIEDNILRKKFSEPRIHVAISCASIGCPPLLSTPFYPETLDSQLTAAAIGFANSDDHNLFDIDTRFARISLIFDWYGDDFVDRYYDASGRFQSLSKKENAALNFLTQYRPADQARMLAEVDWKVAYLEYDWSLNDRR